MRCIKFGLGCELKIKAVRITSYSEGAIKTKYSDAQNIQKRTQ